MKKTISILLAFSVLLCFCSCNKTAPEAPVKESSTQTTEADADKNFSPISLLSVFTGSCYDYGQDDETYEIVSQLTYQTVYLSDKDKQTYPALSESLDEFNSEKTQDFKDKADYLDELSAQQLRYDTEDDEEPIILTANNKCLIQRADNIILSIRSDYDEFTGGAHSNYGTGGYNYDTITGKELTISDVITQTSSLPEILTEKIKTANKLPDEFIEGVGELLKEYSPEQFNWTMNYQGITFYFSPYEIASYAQGLITVTLYFDEYPQLFNEKYKQVPFSYAYGLSEWNDAEFDRIETDDKTDSIYAGMSGYTQDGSYTEITVSLNGNELIIDELELTGAEYYLVNLNGRFYLYIIAAGYNDYSNLLVCDLNGEKPATVFNMNRTNFADDYLENESGNGICGTAFFNNPAQFILETKFDLLSTYSAYKVYSANPQTGIPETTDTFYTIENSNNFVLESKIELEVEILPEMKTQVIPAGSSFELIRTNGIDYVDAKLDDSRECRIYVNRNGSDYGLYINGIPEYEIFEILYYAG